MTASNLLPPAGWRKGAYVMVDAPGGKPDVILIGCGSEVACAYRVGATYRARY